MDKYKKRCQGCPYLVTSENDEWICAYANYANGWEGQPLETEIHNVGFDRCNNDMITVD